MTATPTDHLSGDGLSLAPLRGLRPAVDSERLGHLLCPPYDVIDPGRRAALLAGDPDNAVAVVLPEPTEEGYSHAAQRLDRWVRDGLYTVDETPALYVYEMRDPQGRTTRGLLGAVELRAAEDGVILPHENTMAGPVADRLEVMTRTGTDLEPIYLVYDGGGPASELVRTIDDTDSVAHATTPDGITHRLWMVRDPGAHAAVAGDLGARRALIADGHHRYATYRERQRLRRATDGAGPWDRGLALLVDSTDYGPQVHPIHRVIPGLGLAEAVRRLADVAATEPFVGSAQQALESLTGPTSTDGFAAVLTDGTAHTIVRDPAGTLAQAAARPGVPDSLTALDVTLVHRGLVESAWRLSDDVDTVHYAHDVADALADAAAGSGIAILLRATPVAAVAAVAAAGARMPRKSTLFTPKPASGLVMRRLADQLG
jgi:uncharacterized protein (DUF1015 family)